MEDKIEDTIDSKYIIKRKLGSGGSSSVFIVTERNNNTEYVTKVLKDKDDEIIINQFNNEIKFLTELKQKNIPNIINIIDSGEGPIIRKEKNEGNPEIKKYIVLEYAKNRQLFDFILYFGNGMGENYSKAIFYKIVKIIQSIHEVGICHKDIKLENILLDENFTPKIADFGLASNNSSKLEDYFGSQPYTPPEILANVPYDGFKADIFSLGVTLMSLTFCVPGLTKASSECEFYKEIIDEREDKYWDLVESIIEKDISEEFKDLFIQMVSNIPENRPTIQEVLIHRWFNSYKEMNEEEKANLEKEIIEEFKNRMEKIQNLIMNEIEISNDNSECFENRSAGNDYEYFHKGLKPNKAKDGLDMSFCIKIKGSVDPCEFMNLLCEKIIEKYGTDDCYIETDKKKLKFIAEFGEEDENKQIKGNNVSLKIKLYQNKNDLLLKFFKKEGNKKNFFDKYTEISKLVKSMI